MSQNKKETIILVSIAAILLLITYISIELPERKQAKARALAEQLYNSDELGDVKFIKLERAIVWLENDEVLVGQDKLATQVERVDKFFEILNALVVVRRMGEFQFTPDNQEKYIGPVNDKKISMVFGFASGEIEFIFGKKLQYEDGFYVVVKEAKKQTGELLIVRDSTPQHEPLPEEEYRLNPKKYQRILQLLALNENYFYSLQVFPEEWEKELTKIKFTSWRNREFSLDTKALTTVPPPMTGVEIHSEFTQEFISQFLQLKGKLTVHKFNQELLKNEMAQIEISLSDDKVQVVKIYGNYGSLNGNFLVSSHNPSSFFEIAEDKNELIFPNMQQFWDKRIFSPNSKIPAKHFSGMKDEYFDIEFPLGGSQSLKIPRSEQFYVVRVDKKEKPMPNNETFKTLFSLIFDQAQMVSLMDEQDQKLVDEAFFSISYMNARYYFFSDGQTNFIFDKARGLKYSYLVNESSKVIDKSFTDYFFP